MSQTIRFAAIVLTLTYSFELLAQTNGTDQAKLDKVRQRGVNFLKTAQMDDGSWTTTQTGAITGLATYALLESGVPVDDPAVAKGLKHLAAFVQSDGGIYAPKSHHGTYETSIALLVFHRANRDGRYSPLIEPAEKYVRHIQLDGSKQIDQSDVKFGGAGYSGEPGDRPDLSNTSFFLDALEASGAKSDDPAVKNALVFLSRCQNLESEHNAAATAALVNDGGFIYTPVGGGSSPAGKTENGGLRSYGGMTYAGLKSMVFAGLTPDDKRVKAAMEWVQKHYTVEENPGLGQQGKFYYYHVFSKALNALGKKEIVDIKGQSHDWRADLAAQLTALQQENGSWVNSKNDRWFEGDPNLATSFALMSLKYCDSADRSSKPAK